MLKFGLILSLAAALVWADNFDTCPVDQITCDPEVCKLPDCACSGSEPDVQLSARPQIVYLTFDDAMTAEFDNEFYTELFMPNDLGNYKYTNPNGCPIKATFFVTAKSNDYQVSHKYWRYGHEIAAHSITHRTNTTYWATMSEKEWEDEMFGVKQMLNQFSKIPMDDIIGVRAPFLQGGGDAMYQMLQNKGFMYDCSAPSRLFGYTDLQYGRYPYTLDYYNDMDCQIQPCPNCAFPGVWSQPMLDFEDDRTGVNPIDPDHGFPCSMTDTCQLQPGNNAEEVYSMFMRNFNRSYHGTTRAPIGLYIHSAWFVRQNSWHYDGYKMFLDKVLSYPDVWIVPIAKGIEYFKANNLTNTDLFDNQFEPFNCNNGPEPENCRGVSCQYTVDIPQDIPGPIDYRMSICGPSCPRNFPWLGNPMGNKNLGHNKSTRTRKISRRRKYRPRDRNPVHSDPDLIRRFLNGY